MKSCSFSSLESATLIKFLFFNPYGNCALSEGLAFYEIAKSIVRGGEIERIDQTVEYFREPFGRKIYGKRYGNRTLVIVHNLMGEREIAVPVRGDIRRAYTTENYRVQDGVLRLVMREYSAGAFVLEI